MDYKEKGWIREKNQKNREKKYGIVRGKKVGQTKKGGIGRRGGTLNLKKRGMEVNKNGSKKISGIGREKSGKRRKWVEQSKKG